MDNTQISKAGIADKQVVFGTEAECGSDLKWAVADTGRYKLVLDTKAMTMDAKWLGE